MTIEEVKKLSNDDVRIRISKMQGWSQSEDGYWKDPSGNEWQVMFGFQTYKDGSDILPGYPNDLNSMAEVEDTLTDDQFNNYLFELNELIGRNHLVRFAVCATARQRAIAYLLTVGQL